MDFWETLTEAEKRQCASLANQVREAQPDWRQYAGRHIEDEYSEEQ